MSLFTSDYRRAPHAIIRAEERGFSPKEKKRAGELSAAFIRDQTNVAGQILLKFLTPNDENSVVDFGNGCRGVIDFKSGFVTSMAQDKEIRNVGPKVWHWDDISQLVLDPELNPEKIVLWKSERRKQRAQQKKGDEGLSGAQTELVSPTEEESPVQEFTEKNIEDISLEILDFLSHYKIPGQKIWVSTEEILEYFTEYKKEDVFEALKLLYQYEDEIKKFPSFSPIERATWRHGT